MSPVSWPAPWTPVSPPRTTPIRGTGYEGEIVASNWQAGRALSHYYNLHSDYRVGVIDRHNYFGGGGGGMGGGGFRTGGSF